MADAKNQHDQAVIFNFANEPVIAYAVFPELAEARALKRPSDAAWIIESSEATAEELQDALAVLRVELRVRGLRTPPVQRSRPWRFNAFLSEMVRSSPLRMRSRAFSAK